MIAGMGFSYMALLIPLLILAVVIVLVVAFTKKRGGKRIQDRQPAEDEFDEELRRAEEESDAS